VLPLFALANAGIPLSAELISSTASSPVALGIVFGLLFGKFFGILGFCWIAVKLGIGVLPGRSNWKQLAGVAMLAGIGFTVSLFIAALAFGEPAVLDSAKIGILFASIIAGVLGYLLLRWVSPAAAPERRQAARA
jgi:Na+:H+ antiporter, NhaA family